MAEVQDVILVDNLDIIANCPQCTSHYSGSRLATSEPVVGGASRAHRALPLSNRSSRNYG